MTSLPLHFRTYLAKGSHALPAGGKKMTDLLKYKPTLQINEEHAGIEISFAVKPPQEVIDLLKSNGFRWHYHKKLWFAKHTPERNQFAAKLVDASALAEKSDIPLHHGQNNSLSTNSSSQDKQPNTFAACYDSIGDTKILPQLEGSLYTNTEAFFKKESLYFRRSFGFTECITFLELENAQKVGVSCTEWHLYKDQDAKDTLGTILSNNGADDLKAIWELCISGREIDGLSVSRREHKGVDVFSPFVSVKPLKALPDKWTKRNFTQALMSGQLYRGEVAYRYTDDYAYDAAIGFLTDVGLDMSSFAKNEVGDWGVCTTCTNQTDKPDEYGGCPVTYSEHINSSKTLWFDVNCDIAEGKRRAEDRRQKIEKHNQDLELSCIHIRPSSIDPNKCYSISKLDKHTNTGAYRVISELLQGHVLREYLNPDRVQPDIVSLEELQIEPMRFYTIANFFHRRNHEQDDARIIGCGNWKQIVTGKALLELTKEGVIFPVLLDDDPEYHSYASAYAHLAAQARGTSRFMFSQKQDFAESLNRLDKEFRRTGQNALDTLIQDARKQRPNTSERSGPPEYQR